LILDDDPQVAKLERILLQNACTIVASLASIVELPSDANGNKLVALAWTADESDTVRVELDPEALNIQLALLDFNVGAIKGAALVPLLPGAFAVGVSDNEDGTQRLLKEGARMALKSKTNLRAALQRSAGVDDFFYPASVTAPTSRMAALIELNRLTVSGGS
jgi:hypothetical protein